MKSGLAHQKRTVATEESGFSLVEIVIAMVLFVVVFAATYTASYMAMRGLDGMRQLSRAEDISLANIEYLRTRSWEQLLTMTNTVADPNLSVSTNMIVSLNNPAHLCSYLQLHPNDPMDIFLTGTTGSPPDRTITMQFFPSGQEVNWANVGPSNSMIRATVMVTWSSFGGRRQTNTMTTFISKGGMSATYTGISSNQVQTYNAMGQASY